MNRCSTSQQSACRHAAHNTPRRHVSNVGRCIIVPVVFLRTKCRDARNWCPANFCGLYCFILKSCSCIGRWCERRQFSHISDQIQPVLSMVHSTRLYTLQSPMFCHGHYLKRGLTLTGSYNNENSILQLLQNNIKHFLHACLHPTFITFFLINLRSFSSSLHPNNTCYVCVCVLTNFL